MNIEVNKTYNGSIILVCNGIDEDTLTERKITTDSPAATRKVLGLAKLLSSNGIQVTVVSMGRGKTNGSKSTYCAKTVNVEGIKFLYAPFSHLPLWSQFLTVIGLFKLILSFRKKKNISVLFYNRTPAYIPSMYVSKFLGFKLFLDLEDGYYESIKKETSVRKLYAQIVTQQFSRLCKDGTLLACRDLKRLVYTNNNLVYYGKIDKIKMRPRFTGDRIKILLSGTLSEETGLNLLLDAVNLMRFNKFEWANNIEFHITGNIIGKNCLSGLREQKSSPSLHFHGRLSNEMYKSILRSCDVGLSLKPIGGIQAHTTFPSKILEYGEAGLLIISTDISDVKTLVGEGSVILQENSADHLVEQLKVIANNQNEYRKLAIRGQEILFKACSEGNVLTNLLEFLFNEGTGQNA